MDRLKPPKIIIEDWYDLCHEFMKETNGCLSWTFGYSGMDFHDGEAFDVNRDFLKMLNSLIQKKMDEENG